MADPIDAVFDEWFREIRADATKTKQPRVPVQREMKAAPPKSYLPPVQQPSAARKVAQAVGQFLPGVGEGMALGETMNALRSGNGIGAGVSALGMVPVLGSMKKAKGIKRLFRVEPKELPPMDADDWLAKHLPPEQFAQMKSEKGRLFADDINAIKDYGHGDPDRVTYYIDVPEDVAEAAKRLHHEGKFTEYLVPPEYVAKKTPLQQPKKKGNK